MSKKDTIFTAVGKHYEKSALRVTFLWAGFLTPSPPQRALTTAICVCQRLSLRISQSPFYDCFDPFTFGLFSTILYLQQQGARGRMDGTYLSQVLNICTVSQESWYDIIREATNKQNIYIPKSEPEFATHVGSTRVTSTE